MKKMALSLCALFLVFSASYGFAEMGGGMMKGDEGKSGETKMEHKEMAKKGMMNHDEMMDNMMTMMKQMSGTMDKMSDMMKTMPKDKMMKMHKMMDDMCAQMKRMSKTMKKGACSKKDMQMMQDRQKRMDKMMEEMQTQ